MNTKFAKLNEDGTLTYAPDVLAYDGRILISASAEAYQAAGWHKVTDAAPSVPTGFYARPTGWALENGEIIRHYETVKIEKTPRNFSKLKCYAALVKLGKWAEVKTWLEAQNLWDAFVLAQDVAEDNEYFTAGIAQFKAQFGMTDEDVESILAGCVEEI